MISGFVEPTADQPDLAEPRVAKADQEWCVATAPRGENLLGVLVRARIASRWLLLAIPAAVIGQGLGRAVGIRAFDLGQLAAVAPLVWLGWRSRTIAPARYQRAAAGMEPALSA